MSIKANDISGELTMGLNKSDILHAVMVGLTLVASAVAVPVIASGMGTQPSGHSIVQGTQQPVP